MIVIPNNRKADYLSMLLGDISSLWTAMELHLYKTALTPTGATALATFEAQESTFAGYAAATGIEFGTPFLNASNEGEVSGGAFSFTRTTTGSAQTVYGYYVTNAGNTVLLFSEEIATPKTVTNAGEYFAMVLRMLLDSLS